MAHELSFASRTAAAAVAWCSALLLAVGSGQVANAQGSPGAAPAPNGTWFGTACGGHNGKPVTLHVDPGLRPGYLTRLRIDDLPPQAPAVLMMGGSTTAYGSIALPAPLGGLGLTGCSLLVAPQLNVGFATGIGTVAHDFVVPFDPVLAAQHVHMQVLFAQPGLNPAGMGTSRGYSTRIAPMPTPVTMRSSITQHGITFQFATPVPAGQFVNGDWFVVGPVALTGTLPASQLLNGRVVHGAMLDPDPSTKNHGYDSTLFDPQHYSHARNVAWNLSPANPRVLQPNQALIKTISNLNPALLPALETCAVLTVLDAPPPQHSFRPPYAGTDHAVRFDAQMIDWTQLKSLAPASGMPDFAAEAAKFERPWLDHAPGWVARFLHPTANMPDYGRDLASLYNEAALMCHTSVPLADKALLAIRLVQIGIDCHGNVRNGCFWEGLGGHGSGRKLPILFAGALLRDATMLRIGVDFPSGRQLDGSYTMHFGEDCQTFFVEQTAPNTINWGHGDYTTAHLGMPEFGFSHTHYPENDDVAWATNSYRLCCTANAWIGGVLCARIMGLVDAWNHPALFAYTDRYAQQEPAGWTRSWSPWTGAMWDLHRPAH